MVNHTDTDVAQRKDVVVRKRHTLSTLALLNYLSLCVSGSLWLILSSCSIPVLESPECQAAKQSVREFYSFHFGNDMNFTPENLAARKRFLTQEFIRRLRGAPIGFDPFTFSDNLPRAFKVGGCTADAAGHMANVELIVFWRSNAASEQRIINVRAVKHDDDWLIDGVDNAG